MSPAIRRLRRNLSAVMDQVSELKKALDAERQKEATADASQQLQTVVALRLPEVADVLLMCNMCVKSNRLEIDAPNAAGRVLLLMFKERLQRCAPRIEGRQIRIRIL